MSAQSTRNTDPVNTRRILQFSKIDDITQDATQLASVEKNGGLRQLGNWTLGQAAGHIAAWIDFSFDGTPVKFTWIVRAVGRRIRKKILTQPMRPGGKLPRVPGGTLAVDVLPTDVGLSRLNRACARLKANAPTIPHPIFGRLTPDEWKNLHLRHAELHLSFLRPD